MGVDSSALKKVGVVLIAFLISSSLHGCGNKGNGDKSSANLDDDSIASKLAALERMTQEGCTKKCEFNSHFGRWQQMSHGFMCWDSVEKKAFCQCSASPERPEDCKSLEEPPASASTSSFAALREAPSERRSRPGNRAVAHFDLSAQAPEAPQPPDSDSVDLGGMVALEVEEGSAGLAASSSGGSPRETVTTFCDGAGLAEMHGKEATSDLGGSDATRDLESKILGDVARELESNNVDKMAKEIFSFYICARWAPDETFWQLAEQELAAQMVDSALNDTSSDDPDGDINQTMAEMYQSYRFVPMLCSQNLEVFGETDDEDKTYFRKFKTKTRELAKWLGRAAQTPVGKSLTELDKTFCGDKPMNSCNRGDLLSKIAAWFGNEPSKEEKFEKLKEKLQDFGGAAKTEKFQEDFKDWKKRLPYHSFIGKPKGWEADHKKSPSSAQRFVVCFGKRVASELHRRPNGQHILTDQNNIGCHGWWTAEEASKQIDRMVKLWAPPTCQLATMTYTMKKEIMAKFQEMNERLFDSMPSMINDELMEEELDGEFNHEDHLPKPFAPKEWTDGSRVFVDGMRVQAVKKGGFCVREDEPGHCQRGFMVKEDWIGVVEVVAGKLQAKFSGLPEDARETSFEIKPSEVRIVPHGWKAKKGFHGHVKDLVAGIGKIHDKAKAIFDSFFSKRQNNLAELMSGSVSKWAVCPIKQDANFSALDENLGVEDAAFQDFQLDAYKKWTGFEKAIPGEKCVDSAEILGSVPGFEKTQVCEINELHADHVEKYTKNESSGELENFVCPLRPPLPADEQLAVLMKKKGTCFLRMTGTQQQQYSWHYQGRFPARKQNDRKENLPKTDYELVRLMKVGGNELESQTNIGRFCSLQELSQSPRFCVLPKVHNEWSSLEDFASSMADSIAAVAVKTGPGKDDVDAMAPLGLGATAMSDAISSYQGKLEQKEKTWKEKAKKVSIALGEKTWDKLRGAGRLARSTAYYIKDKIKGEVASAGRMSAELEQRLFGSDINGEVLHSLSFQRSIGANAQSSNAKERFQRYVVSYPCPDFDPAFEYAVRTRWGRIALRMVREAFHIHKHKTIVGGEMAILGKPSLHLAVRGDALRFQKENKEAKDNTFFMTGASMLWKNGVEIRGEKMDKCEWTGPVHGTGSCQPEGRCMVKGLLRSCVPKPWWDSPQKGGWWPVDDRKLVDVVAPAMTTGHGVSVSDLSGLEMSLYCGPKKAFGSQGPPESSQSPPSLLECLKEGVETNARLKSKEPWKLYFPDEIVVVATFEAIQSQACMLSQAGLQSKDKQAIQSELCRQSGADARGELVEHLVDGQGEPHMKEEAGSNDRFMGLATGFGWPTGALEEVVLSPEDVLEALDLISSSHGR